MGDPVEKLAEEVAKQLPVKEAYTDLLSPGMRQAGKAIEDVTKTLRLALLPFEAAGVLYERVSRLLHESISRVPEVRRVPPQPQILGPVVEGVRYEEAGTPLSDMFSELLSKAFDEDHAHTAHPAYPAMIRQLSADEALVLRALWEGHLNGKPVRMQSTMDWVPATGRFVNRLYEVDELPRNKLRYPDNMNFYIDHLHALGLAGIYKDDEKPIHGVDGQQTGTRVFETLRLAPLGVRFMEAVSPISR